MNKRQTLIYDEFKNEVLNQFPNSDNCIYLEKYDVNSYVVAYIKPSNIKGESVCLLCDIAGGTIIVKSDNYYSECAFKGEDFILKLKEAISIVNSLYKTNEPTMDTTWREIKVESFWDTRYNDKLSLLEICFPSGIYYYYYDFSYKDVNDLLSSENPLLHFNKAIRPNFKYDKVFGDYASEKANRLYNNFYYI